MLDDNKLSEYLKNSTAFNMKLKKIKRKLHKFLENHPDSSIPIKIRGDARRNDGVKLPKNRLRKISGDPLYWKSFNKTFKAAVHSSDSTNNIEKFSYLKAYLELKGLP